MLSLTCKLFKPMVQLHGASGSSQNRVVSMRVFSACVLVVYTERKLSDVVAPFVSFVKRGNPLQVKMICGRRTRYS